MTVVLSRWLPLALIALSGCSLVFVRRPPSTPLEASAPIECTTSRVAPLADLLVGLGGTGLGIAMASSERPSCSSTCGFERSGDAMWCSLDRGLETAVVAGSVIAIGVGVAVMVVSSIRGFESTARCARLKGWQGACNGGDGAACAALAAPSPRLARDDGEAEVLAPP